MSYTKNKLIKLIPEEITQLQLELLKKILPLNLDTEYILNKKNINKPLDNICVLFTDIVSYTKLAYDNNASIISTMLHQLYTIFDSIIIKYNLLQKIETIGDAYMVVGDINTNNDNHIDVTKEIILLAIEFIIAIKKIETPNKKPLQIRIGIHIGDIIYGVLGFDKPRLCIIGNTVNHAARLQSTAKENTIQISEKIYNIIITNNISFANIEYISNKDVFLKNIGYVDTYTISLNKT